ncbi:MAG: alpha/beta fold hydrolase [Acidimicrobiales bacterium]
MSEGPPLPPGRHLELAGRGQTFVREQSGPPGAPTVVLLHGWTAGSDLTWFACFEPLSHHFRVLSIDHRGHGRGIRTGRRFRLGDCADDVAALVAAVDPPVVGPVIVVGYSMGGVVAQLLWRRHRHLVAGLVLCSTSRNFAESTVERRYFAALGGLALASRATPGPLRRRLARRVIGRRGIDGPDAEWILDELHRNDWTAVLEAGWELGRFDSRPWAGEIDVPTAVVATMADRQVLPRRQLALAQAIPGASVHEVDGPHDACVTQPERFVPVLVEACRSVAARATRLRVGAVAHSTRGGSVVTAGEPPAPTSFSGSSTSLGDARAPEKSP